MGKSEEARWTLGAGNLSDEPARVIFVDLICEQEAVSDGEQLGETVLREH